MKTLKNCKHDVVSSVVSSLNKCECCSGPFSAFKWFGVKCKVCLRFWHKTCYNKNESPKTDFFNTDKLDFTDSEQSEDSDAEMPQTQTETDIDSALEGPSEDCTKDKKNKKRNKHEQPGVKKARQTVKKSLGTSDDIDSALEGSSQVILENSAERVDARRQQKRIWSPTEVSAVMRHFRHHIARGKLATKIECQQCKNAEHPALASRSVQNIRDFVRNRGLTLKKKQSQNNEYVLFL
ncbi:uncharacterized protein LOC124376792 isoform X2 [Silurus meridionalis]|uniref:uncharacterized protein LOC124376792 isoform X2 n=1 Tax=Silurus meridionalis TaxID=175797 RepID=UPI001EEAA98C|nr:uncharacterized protein LOC124376792 isoform X2 [Silurus meridionalis]